MQQLPFDGVLKWDFFWGGALRHNLVATGPFWPLKHHHQKSPGWNSASAQTEAAESVGGGAQGKREH